MQIKNAAKTGPHHNTLMVAQLVETREVKMDQDELRIYDETISKLAMAAGNDFDEVVDALIGVLFCEEDAGTIKRFHAGIELE